MYVGTTEHDNQKKDNPVLNGTSDHSNVDFIQIMIYKHTHIVYEKHM